MSAAPRLQETANARLRREVGATFSLAWPLILANLAVTVMTTTDYVMLGRLSPDAVLVTIPDAPRERLDAIIEACRRAAVPCSFVRRQIDIDPTPVLGAAVE